VTLSLELEEHYDEQGELVDSYFNHSIHVNKGIGCKTCHGRVDRIPHKKGGRFRVLSPVNT
jgi:hypothetical protein